MRLNEDLEQTELNELKDMLNKVTMFYSVKIKDNNDEVLEENFFEDKYLAWDYYEYLIEKIVKNPTEYDENSEISIGSVVLVRDEDEFASDFVWQILEDSQKEDEEDK